MSQWLVKFKKDNYATFLRRSKIAILQLAYLPLAPRNRDTVAFINKYFQYLIVSTFVMLYNLHIWLWHFSFSVNSFFKRTCAAIEFSGARCLIFCRTLHIYSYFMYANSKGSGSPEPSLVAYVISTIFSWAGVRFTKVFRTELGHKYILVECSVIALCYLLCQKFPVINSCAINRTMIGMSIKRISVLNLCHVLKSFVKSTPGSYVRKSVHAIRLWPSW